MAATAGFGFIKCHFVPDDAESYAQDKIIAKVSKTLAKALDIKSIVSCYLQASNEAYMSEAGVQMIKTDLEVMGTNEILDSLE